MQKELFQVTTKTLRADRMRDGKEVLSSKPQTVPIPIPSIAAQIHELTRLGQARVENWQLDNDDQWDDHLDDLGDGLTQHEIDADPELTKTQKFKRKTSAKTPAKKSALPAAEDSKQDPSTPAERPTISSPLPHAKLDPNHQP